MYGIGYRTVAARMLSGRALKTAGLGAAVAFAPLSAVGIASTAIPLIAGQLAYNAASAALDALGPRMPAFRAGMQRLAGFAGRGGPAGFVGGALLGYLLAYLAYYAANRGPGYTTSFAGFTPVLDCGGQSPAGRDPLGNPAFCDILQIADRDLNEPYIALELASGFQTQWKYLPLVNRWATVAKYVPNGEAQAERPVSVDHRPYSDEMLGAGYEALRNITTNPWPEASEDTRSGYPPIPRALDGFAPAISPAIDAGAMPIGRIAPNPNSLVLPYRLRIARRDAGNPFLVDGYGWQAGPRPGEFPPVAFPQPVRVPSVTIDRDGNQTPDRVKPNTPAVARMHERKVKAASQGAAQQIYMKMFGAMTETGEFIDSIYNALPEKIRANDYFANGKHDLGRDKKLWSIYQNYRAIDVDLMVRNIVFDNLQDAVIGKASRDITVASGGSPISRTLGLF